MTDEAQSSESNPVGVVVDLGKAKRKQIKRLRKGRGKVFREASQLFDELLRNGEVPEGAFPVYLVVREKPESLADSILRY